MGLEGSLEYITPTDAGEIFEFGKSSATIHHIILKISSSGDMDRLKIISDKESCELSLQQIFELSEILEALSNDESLGDELELDDWRKGKLNRVGMYSQKLNRALVSLFIDVCEYELNKRFIYFKYTWS